MPEIDLTKALIGVTALAAAFGALASATGAFDQMQRNAPQWTAAVFGAAVFAGLLIVMAGIVTGRWEKAFVVVSLAFFGFAAVTGIVFLVQAQGDRPPPGISLKFDSEPSPAIVGTIKVQEMTSSESLKVSVLAQGPSDGVEADRLLDARLGSDTSGSVDYPLDVPIPVKKYSWVTVLAWVGNRPTDCFAEVPAQQFKNTPGCIVMRLPEGIAASS